MCAKFSHFGNVYNPIQRVFIYPVCGIKVNSWRVLLNWRAFGVRKSGNFGNSACWFIGNLKLKKALKADFP